MSWGPPYPLDPPLYGCTNPSTSYPHNRSTTINTLISLPSGIILITPQTHTHKHTNLSPPMERLHVLLVTFPAQGHINPSLQFAKRLINMGIHVTFATSISACRRMTKTNATAATTDLLTFAAFSDGYDDGYKAGDDANKFMSDMRSHGSKAIKHTISAAARDGRPVTCVVYTLLLPWVADVASELHVPGTLLWIQPATVLCIYYYYFNGFQREIEANSNELLWSIRFPGGPLLEKRDLPSFLVSSNSDAYSFVLTAFKEQLDALKQETKPKILINTLESLEEEALTAIDKYEMIAIGPLIPSAFLDGGDPWDKSFGGDLFQKSNDDDIEWLDLKPESSVVYISFGSIIMLQKPQLEEIAKGLLGSGRPFLWVIRDNEDMNRDEYELSCLSDLERVGKIVPWCTQMEVLMHSSVGCFITHCGWNSTLESLSCGVPVVAFPHWTDQGTNAKLIEDVWKIGVRVRYNDDGIVESGEIKRCVEEVMDGGERSRDMRENAERWKGLAREGVGENGSSTKNLKAFLERVGH